MYQNYNTLSTIQFYKQKTVVKVSVNFNFKQLDVIPVLFPESMNPHSAR